LKILEVKKINDSTVGVKVIQNNQEKELDGIILIAYDKENNEIARDSLSMQELEGKGFEVELALGDVSNAEKITISPISISNSGKETIKQIQDEYIFSEDFGKVVVSECVIYSQCDDKIKCTTDSCSGGFCLHTKITSCINSDGCCPTGCTHSKDNDCASSGGGGGGGGSGTTCTDTCTSLNYWCGDHAICGTNVNCGGCSAGYSCQVSNSTCMKDVVICIPSCAGKNCGIDGCGGSCGTCGTGYSCQVSNSTCMKDVIVTCNGVNCKVGEYCSNGVCLLNVTGHTYFVATNGNDNAAGTFAAPWRTWDKAFHTALAGDIVYFRGGVYYQVDTSGGGIVVDPRYPASNGHGGTVSNPIRYFNYPGEKPILDCSNVNPSSVNNGLVFKFVNYTHVKGLTIRNVFQVNYGVIATGFYLWYGSTGVTIENMAIYNVDGEAFSSVESLNVSFINCDAYNCQDSNSDFSPGQYGTGFGITNELYDNAYVLLYGCRAWNCSDQGFAGRARGLLVIDHCWAFDNSGNLAGDGHGFKPTSPDSWWDNPPIQRQVTNCISANNAFSGFDTNDLNRLACRMVWYNNFAYHNGYKGKTDMDAGSGFRILNPTNDGNIRILKNNLAYDNEHYGIYAEAEYTHSYNAWDLPVTVSAADFVSLDYMQLYSPREANGSLPTNVTFGHLRADSDLINKGVNVGLPSNGAPDLGAFETNY
jgi:hypothetical protein